jgi:hypothetical protein
MTRFQLAESDAGRPLVIDPVGAYSTYLGGNSNEYAYGIAVAGRQRPCHGRNEHWC